MILSTDVYAAEDTWALQILPLPSEPTVTKGEWGSFENASSLINDYVYDVRRQEKFKVIQVLTGMIFTALIAGVCASVIAVERMRVPAWLVLLLWLIAIFLSFLLLFGRHVVTVGVLIPRFPEGVEILFHENVGVHNIVVVRSENAQELVSWAESYLDNRVVLHELSFAQMQDLTARYIERGINCFVFDLVYLEEDPWSVNPIVYRFKSDSLYYPLEISSVISGSTEITVVAITDGKLKNQQIENSGLTIKSARGVSLEFCIGEEKLGRISPEVARMFDDAWLTTLTYDGPLADLSGDLTVSAVKVEEIKIDVSMILFWVSVVCLWGILIGVTYQTLRLQERQR
jgi:hypothetical protein